MTLEEALNDLFSSLPFVAVLSCILLMSLLIALTIGIWVFISSMLENHRDEKKEKRLNALEKFLVNRK